MGRKKLKPGGLNEGLVRKYLEDWEGVQKGAPGAGWKFMKAKEGWLLRNIYRIDGKLFPLACEYLRTVKGNTLWVRTEAENIVSGKVEKADAAQNEEQEDEEQADGEEQEEDEEMRLACILVGECLAENEERPKFYVRNRMTWEKNISELTAEENEAFQRLYRLEYSLFRNYFLS